MHTARMERKRRIEEDRRKRLVGKKRESLFDEALNYLESHRKIKGVLPDGRTRHVVVVRETYKSFPMYPTGCSPTRIKERQEEYPNIIFVPVRIDESLSELTKEILYLIDGNGTNSN